ncbi:SDR family oxidoreductase [Ramlibacter tataouinensis]|uniref:UDP-galactose 4-epimerase n=1 Tax=Ramlibacter tataouinensis (strain ATCC BAA-407 / DSM 14655 / LMG 21543 / TTB310) TaxID=365046 RepID=F5XW15_RAMTT|nr:SDR family oxidoreductase [Ramlibacter tataouinensis]AEG94118.1 UDP-galactose 4-epimerase [Ramlibacter tataouinensis TTB310]
MKIFVTGATGFIGGAVVRELLTAGHRVVGLARSDAADKTLTRMGVEAHRGELADLDSLAAGARACDGVIHTAFIHDFAQYEANARTDQRALKAMADALEGTNKPLVATSGTAVLAPGRIGTEADSPAPDGLGSIRAASEVVLAAADRGVRVSIVRLPPSVHDRGDHGFVPALIDVARRTGVAAYVGDGDNRWPAVHRLDAARLFRLALEKAPPGARLHGVGEEGVPMRSIAEAIGTGLGIPARSMSADEAAAHFGWMALFVGIDNSTSSAQTRASLGWQPQQIGLLDDMQASGYFS